MAHALKKPEFSEVYSYAMDSVSYNIRKIASHLPADQKEEIQQEAAIRVWKAYQILDVTQGWKSFIQWHTKGAVQDYLKLGHGNIEDGFVSNEAMDGLKYRVSNSGFEEDSDIDCVDQTLAKNGVHTESQIVEEKFKPRWELLSRMAGDDDDLHIVCKVLLGYSQRQIAEQYTKASKGSISRERVSQRIYEFFAVLDSSESFNNPWVSQCIYALGLSDYYKEKEIDNGLGWNLKAFNLCSSDSFKTVKTEMQITFADVYTGFYPVTVSRKLIPTFVRVKKPRQAKIHQLSFLEDNLERIAL